MSSTPSRQKLSIGDDDIPLTLRPLKRQRLIDDCDSDSTHYSVCTDLESDLQVVAEVKNDKVFKPVKRFFKSDDDKLPLPDPFPLPKNYKADIDVALKTGKMTRETKKRFFSAVAAAMFTYKKYPQPEDYQNVARCVVSKYPFLKSPVGSPHVSIQFCFFSYLHLYIRVQ